jgi:quercetin dioxygenase-like cupin family protein
MSGMAFQSALVEEAAAAAKEAAGGYAGGVLRSDRLSVGVYVLAAGASDPQHPHEQDEVYYVVRGRARFQVDGGEHHVEPGSLLFVRAGAGHRFHDIHEELVLIVFWAPPHD